MKIKVLITGGTFDKEYNELNGSLCFKETHLPDMLKLGRSRVPVKIENLMMMDSLDMTDEHRDVIVKACVKSSENQIIVTHGTDTMVETARMIAAKVKNKTVVLVGAMVPYEFGSSDGLFNLGSAFGFVQTLPVGVYIAMNGRYFKWDNVRKNKQLGEFEEIR